MAGADMEERHRLQTLSATLRENAWELAVEAVQEGMVSGTVPRLGELGPLDRVGDIPAFIGELAREIADPQAARFDGAGAAPGACARPRAQPRGAGLHAA